MELRTELLPPRLNEAEVLFLTELASRLDGAQPGLWKEDLIEFNRVAGTSLPIEDFQGIYESEEHETWVQRTLIRQAVRPAADVTRAELAEIVFRAMPTSGYADFEAYMAIFDANVPSPGASVLIFFPMDYDPATNKWNKERQMGEYNPTPEQIVNWALAHSINKGSV